MVDYRRQLSPLMRYAVKDFLQLLLAEMALATVPTTKTGARILILQ